MKFIELTLFSGGGRLLINPLNISSIYQGRRLDKQGNSINITCIQEVTSSDNYWEVTETIDEVIALIDKCRNTDKKGEYTWIQVSSK